MASLLHDVGTVAVSERVLLKPGPLNAQEREVVELHPRIGAQVISQVPALRPLAPAILHHHERYDGTGLPERADGRRHPRPRAAHRGGRRVQRDAARPSPPLGAQRRARRARCSSAAPGPSSTRRWCACSWRRCAATPGSSSARGSRRPKARPIPLLGAGVGALTDSLTLLPSHRAFRDSIATAAENATLTGVPFTVLFVRLLDLKRLNRREGYGAGDELLQACARALDRLAVRLGATPGRDGGARLGLLVPPSGRATARGSRGASCRSEMGAARAVRVASAVWRPGDTGEALVRRALRRLAEPGSA